MTQTPAPDTSVTVPANDFFAPSTLQTLFWRPRFLSASPTMAHVPLLFWLCGVLRPRSVVVLGADDGVAHFALCQALDKLGIAGWCHGYGFWADATPETMPPAVLCQHEEQLYEGMSHLTAGLSADAVFEALTEASADLIFVDLTVIPEDTVIHGEELLARLSTPGVLILHGTNALVRRKVDGPGLSRLIRKSRHIEMRAEAGLTLIVKGDEVPQRLRSLLDRCPDGVPPADVTTVFRRSGQGLQSMIAAQESDAVRVAHEEKLATAMAALQQAETALVEKSADHDDLKARYSAQGDALAKVQSNLAETEARIAEVIAERDAARAALAEVEAQAATERKTRFEETALLTQMAEERHNSDRAAEARIAELTAERDAAQAALAVAEAQAATERKATLEETAARIAELTAERDTAQAALAAAEAQAATERRARFEETAVLTRLAEQRYDSDEVVLSKAQHDTLRQHISGLEAQVAGLLDSTSWKLTAPIRRIRTALAGKE